MVDETEEVVNASLAAMRANLKQKPAWGQAPPPTDDFLLMFLRSEVFKPHKAADRYRKYWKVWFRIYIYIICTWDGGILCGNPKIVAISVRETSGGAPEKRVLLPGCACACS